MVPTLTDTQRRFLAAVVQRLPLERVQEVYLFSPLKQGGVETGVAVIAAGDEVPPPGPGDGAVRAAEESDPTEAAAREDEGEVLDVSDGSDGSADADAGVDADACVVVGDNVAAALEAGDPEGAVEALAVEQPEDALEGDSPEADADDEGGNISGDATSDAVPEAADEARDDETIEVAAPRVRPSRFTIFTARYRLQLKGPDRGKWEVDVVEEADAPLVTVDAVVRGVQRRAGELSAVERLSPTDLDAALDDRPWTRQ